MDDKEHNLQSEIDFRASEPRDVNNDPWIPLSQQEENIVRLPAPPNDPVKEIISSEMYINSLEKKLSRIKGKQTKDDRLAQFLTETTQDSDCYVEDQDYTVTSLFSLQRKINPEKQALNPLELLPLLQNDVLAKAIAKENDNEETSSMGSKQVTTSCS